MNLFRAELQTNADSLRAEIREGDGETRRYMRVLHERDRTYRHPRRGAPLALSIFSAARRRRSRARSSGA